MTKYYKLGALLLFVIIILVSAFSCGPSVTQEEYDRLLGELNDAERQLASLQRNLAEVEKIEAQYEDLSTQFEELNTRFIELKKQNDINLKELDTIQSQYDELKKKYDAIVKQSGAISTEDVEQALFDLINQTRIDNGLEVLLPGEHIYDIAKANNIAMVEAKEYKYSPEAGWQEIFWAAGYDTADAVANGALLIWKSNIDGFNQSILNINAIYGAVSAYKSGDIIYITYISHVFS